MNRAELLGLLRNLSAEKDRDFERSHSAADAAVYEYLDAIDPELAKAYLNVGKWYA